MTQEKHWEKVYSRTPSRELGWYEPHLQTSLGWIEELSLGTDSSIIDVGGGASTLVDDLLHAGYRSITVLDISEKALSSVRERLGKKAELVTWLTGDITLVDLPSDQYELWHDRAVLHFLTEPDQQRQYRHQLLKALKPGGQLVIGTFAPEAPPKCSGLPVQRYSKKRLRDLLGAEFELIRHQKEQHVTPAGAEQIYLYCQFRRTD
jgi:SAM-dependent methyltransferase